MSKILIDKSTVKLAIEALNTAESDYGSRAWERGQEAITALREALAEQTAQRKPLGNEEIYKIYRDCGDLNVKINIARAIEAAHGIKENT